ncbi:hypothetical protein BGX20_001699 [Mortierella sp. AD010]|nr:hypothetical protein BGX20_001699 [Mortierella sp. AD010]
MKLMHDPHEGYDSYLREVQNVFPDRNAVLSVFGDNSTNKNRPCADIDVLALDLGEAFTVGACAKRANDTKYRLNLAANRKALYQPRRKFRHLLENRKSRVVDGETIANIESNLPSFEADSETREAYEATHWNALNGFYNDPGLKHLRHDWDAGRAHRAEFALLTDRLLSMVGGTIGKKRESNKKVVIGIRLGKFGTNTKLTSLHSSFSAYFVGKVRSLVYLVVGVNEFYTSKRCPNCKGGGTHPTDFVGSITIRQLFCEQCKTYFHRDEMAASNMVNAICSQLQNNKRPNYLLPVDESGKFVVKRQSTSEITAQDRPETYTSESETQTSESETDSRKRKAVPEARTLRKRHQTYESETNSESDSSWQSSEEEGKRENDGDGEEDYEEDGDNEEEDDE